jgi:hypothetical protein
VPRKRTPATYLQQRAFIAAFKVTHNTSSAAAAAKVDTNQHRMWLQRDEVYRKAWEDELEAIGQTLEDEALRRAHEGVKKTLYYKGKPIRTGRGKSRIAYETEYSDQLLIALLKRFRPALYRERTMTEVTGSVEIVDRLQAARRRVIEMQKTEQAAG